MLRPKIFVISFLVLLLLVSVLFFYFNNSSASADADMPIRKPGSYGHAGKNISVVFLDITESDTARNWMQKPYRDYFIQIVNKCLRGSRDVLAVYLLHGKTRDAQPFWTNYPLSAMPAVTVSDSVSLIGGVTKREQCIEAYDSVMTDRYALQFNAQDSLLLSTTDIFGAVNQASLYFKNWYASTADKKQLFILSDNKENAGSAPVKLNNISSVSTAAWLADEAAKQFALTSNTTSALRNSYVYMLSPNNRLFVNEDRYLRRIFWESFFIKKMHCRSVYYF